MVYKTVCPDCEQDMVLEYDPGYPNTYEEPGEPADWYTNNHDSCTITADEWNTLRDNATASPDFQEYMRAESLV